METFDQFLTLAPEILFKLIIAVLCGGAFGMERERLGKPAGLRTNILICVGSMLYTIMSVHIGEFVRGGATGPVGSEDVSRIASQIVVGIGFIGAGTIMRERGSVVGLTSAAMVWMMAAVGIFIGAGFVYIAVGVTVFSVLMLLLLGRLELRVLGRCVYAPFRARFRDDNQTRTSVVEVLAEYEISPEKYSFSVINGEIVLEMQYCIKHATHQKVIHALHEVPGFMTFTRE